MNKHGCKTCPPKKRRKSDNSCKKIGILMLLLGCITVMSMFLPVKLLLVMMCIILIICGALLVK